jgi:hypothetical protein
VLVLELNNSPIGAFSVSFFSHALHSIHVISTAISHWRTLAIHCDHLDQRSFSHYTQRLYRSFFYPWFRETNLLQVSTLFHRRIHLRSHWRAWIIAHDRREKLRALRSHFVELRRKRLFYAWHQLREANQGAKEVQWTKWRRMFLLHRKIRAWTMQRVVRCWVRLIEQRDEDAEKCEAYLEQTRVQRNQRTIQGAWNQWRARAEERFEATFLQWVDDWRRSSTTRKKPAMLKTRSNSHVVSSLVSCLFALLTETRSVNSR